MASRPPLGLYIHWPFCLAKCPYCDFNSHLRAQIDHGLWAERLVTEMETLCAMAESRDRRLASIFIGGGTPSLMAPATMASLIDAARRLFGFSDGIEITMEANPTSAEAANLAAFAQAGVNRLSMGIQALDDADLIALGREHSGDEALAALGVARSIFARVSADFIYARPHQTEPAWQDELSRILELELGHLSLYQLTLEPGTAFYSRHRRGLLTVPDDDAARRLYDITQRRTGDAGLPGYEISNHSAPGQESRHNLVYWRAQDWIGIGPGAYGRYWRDDARIETRCRRDPDAWLDQVAKTGSGLEDSISEHAAATAAEAMMMGLRLKEGVDLAAIASRAGPVETWLDQGSMTVLARDGLIKTDGNRLQLTDDGVPVINSVLARLLR